MVLTQNQSNLRDNKLVLRQDKESGLEVVDLAKDPPAAGPQQGPLPEIQILTTN